MYSPTLGRFISQDPIGFQAGDVNLFRFVGNNPTNATDPAGLSAQPTVAPPPREVGVLWTTGPGRFPLGSKVPFVFKDVTWVRADGTTCKADVTARIYGYRMFRPEAKGKDNSRGMFKVFVELEYSYKNVRCAQPCKPEVKEEDFVSSTFSLSMDNHIFLHGEISNYVFRFDPGMFETFEQRFLDGFYKLTPDAPPKK